MSLFFCIIFIEKNLWQAKKQILIQKVMMTL